MAKQPRREYPSLPQGLETHLLSPKLKLKLRAAATMMKKIRALHRCPCLALATWPPEGPISALSNQLQTQGEVVHSHHYMFAIDPV